MYHAWEGIKKYIQNVSWKMLRDHLGNLTVDGRIIFK
jgi:hypothetical protein